MRGLDGRGDVRADRPGLGVGLVEEDAGELAHADDVLTADRRGGRGCVFVQHFAAWTTLTARSLRCWPRTRADRTATSASRCRCRRPRSSAASTACAPSGALRGFTAVVDHAALGEATEALVELFYAPGHAARRGRRDAARAPRGRRGVERHRRGRRDRPRAHARQRRPRAADHGAPARRARRPHALAGRDVAPSSTEPLSRPPPPTLRARPWRRSRTSTTPSAARIAPGACACPSTPRRASRSSCPRRAPERAAARGGRRAAAVDRAAAARGRGRPRRDRRARRAPCRTSARRCTLVPQAGPHARAPPRRRAARPRAATRARRSSAGTAGMARDGDRAAAGQAVARARHAVHEAHDPQPEDALGQLLVAPAR